MKTRLALFALVYSALLASIACDTTCSSGSVCGDHNVLAPNPVPSASATPWPVPQVTVDPCRVESIQITFHGGEQVPNLPLGEVKQLDATPYNTSGQVSDGCNLARTPIWTVQTPANCSLSGGGYNPFLKGLKVGLCSVTASLTNVVGNLLVDIQ